LPVGTYEIGFHKMMGFFLKDHADLDVKEEKVYGSSPVKVEKVLKGFQKVDRNFGVILSGKKGIGKSLFAR
jgi:DNA replication protein DnaC